MPAGSFAIAYTVKDEAKLLPSAIEYHLAAGCALIFVFWDGTTDNAPALITGRDKVITGPNASPDDMPDEPWIAETRTMWDGNMDVRKRFNTLHAARVAAEQGIEWIISIDPDELVIPSPAALVDQDMIPGFLGTVPDRYDQVLLRNLETVATASHSDQPFRDCTLFLRRFPLTELLSRASRAALWYVLRNPVAVAWYDYLFYKARFLGAVPRRMVDPETGRTIPRGYFLGYANHKAFMRTRRAHRFNFDIHKWRRASGPKPRSTVRGNVLHYDLFDAAYMAAKFRQRGPNMLVSAFHTRHMLAVIARKTDDAMVDRFFTASVAITDPAKVDQLRRRGIVAEITGPSDYFRELERS